MPPPSRQTSTASATPGQSQTARKPPKSRRAPGFVAVPEDTMIPTVMSSSNGRTLFSASWWAEITKKDDFWKEFEKYVARTTIDRRLRSPIDSKHVRVVTEFQMRKKKATSLGQGLPINRAAQEMPETEDEMSDLEASDEDLEDILLNMETTTPTKTSIEVVVPPYSSISTYHPPPAGKSIPEPATAADSVEQSCSTHSFITLPVALPTTDPAPATITTPPSQLGMESPWLKRKYDEFMAGDETLSNTPEMKLEAKVEPEAYTIKTDVDNEEMTPITYPFTPAPTTYSSISFTMTPNDTITTIKNESWPTPTTPSFPVPTPKRTIKLEADSEEYLEFQKFRQLKESLLVRSPSLGPGLKASASADMEEEEEETGKGKRVKLE